MNEDIFFLGKISQNNIVEIMQKHLIFLTTKLHDPCSNAIIEAMACGLPLIVSDWNGNKLPNSGKRILASSNNKIHHKMKKILNSEKYKLFF